MYNNASCTGLAIARLTCSGRIQRSMWRAGQSWSSCHETRRPASESLLWFKLWLASVAGQEMNCCRPCDPRILLLTPSLVRPVAKQRLFVRQAEARHLHPGPSRAPQGRPLHGRRAAALHTPPTCSAPLYAPASASLSSPSSAATTCTLPVASAREPHLRRM